MKKITLFVTLLGSVYLSNAQVGIGTSTPNTSSMLDIVGSNKGVLIPRVNLTDLTEYTPITGTETASLLVYATGKKDNDDASDVKSGFYYWVPENGSIDAHWERIVNQADLDAAVQNQTSDLNKIKNLLNFVYPSNAINGETTATGGGLVFTAANGGTAAKIEFVKWNGTAYVREDVTSVISDLIMANETNTSIVKSKTGTIATNDIVIDYKYFNEEQPDTTGTANATISLNTDVLDLINGNSTIKNAIKNLVNSGANVGYTTSIISVADNTVGENVGLVIPAKSFYYVDEDGVKVEIPLKDIVYQGINQFTQNQINSTKLKLGDNLSTTSFTGDTITVNGSTHYIYRGVYLTTVTGNQANTTGVTLGQTGSKILSIDLRYDGGIVASVTDIVLDGTSLGFKIGTGKMYSVLGEGNISAEVIVEFASPALPAFVTP